MYGALSASVGWSFFARCVNDSLKFSGYTQERKVGAKMGTVILSHDFSLSGVASSFR